MQATKGTVLLVEDDRDLRETIADGLEAAGYEVVQSDSVRNVLKQLSSSKVVVVIMDLVLVGDSGATLLRYLKMHPLLKKTKTIMISGFEHGEQAARLWGADLFLQKPVRIGQLIEAVNQLAVPPAA